MHAVSVWKDDLGIGVQIGFLGGGFSIWFFPLFSRSTFKRKWILKRWIFTGCFRVYVCMYNPVLGRAVQGSCTKGYTYVSRAWLDAWTTDNDSSPATNTNHEPRGWMRGAPRWHGRAPDHLHPTRRDHAQSTRWASLGWGSTDPWSGCVDGRSEVLFCWFVYWRVTVFQNHHDFRMMVVGYIIKVELSWVSMFVVVFVVLQCVYKKSKKKNIVCFAFKLKYEKKLNKKKTRKDNALTSTSFLIFSMRMLGFRSGKCTKNQKRSRREMRCNSNSRMDRWKLEKDIRDGITSSL